MIQQNKINTDRDLLVWQNGMALAKQYLTHAEGSLAELDAQLTLAVELGYPQDPNVSQTTALVGELQKMLTALRRKVEARLSTDYGGFLVP